MADLPKLYTDNPGGDWLKSKLEWAQEDYQTAPSNTYRKNLGGTNITGYFKESLNLPPNLLQGFPGAMGEDTFRESSVKLQYLQESIQEEGYKPSPILIHVREDGQPFVVEGNHRIAEAVKTGRDSIPVELKYLRGAEDAEGSLSPKRLQEIYGLPPSEPRSTALATLAIPSEEDTSQEKPKQTGKAWRGIGSLMRKRIFPIAQVAQQAWSTLSDEQKDQVTKFLNNPVDFGLGRGEYPPGFKGGLDYFRQMLGMGPEQPEGGIASLPDLREGLDFYHGTPNVWEAEGEDYPVGRPDLTFMGTGEGQQLYAPGFYGGEERDVAWEYAEFLGTKYGKVPNLYKGKIPAEIVTNKFIDFNFPVSEQSQTVQDAFKNLGYEPKNPDRFSGADILERMKRNMGEDPAIEALRKAGVVGLRYLDQYSRQNKNLYKGKSIVKPNGEALFMNEDWQRQTRNVLKYLVDENVSVGDFILQQREDLGAKGWLSRLFSSSRQEEKFLDILEGTNVSKSPLTRNLVIWDQPLLNELGKTIKKEMAHGGFIDKPLYERTL